MNPTLKNISLLRTTQDSEFRGWLGNELNFDKSATHWELLKTQENVDDWDWTQRWELSNSLITTQDWRKCPWLGLGLTFEKSTAAWWHRQLLGTFLPTVGSTQPVLCLGIGMSTQHGPVPVWAKTTLWHSRVTLVHYCWSLASIARQSVDVTELHAAKDLAATCMTSSKWDIISHHSISLKVVDSCWYFLWRDEERTSLICREKKVNNWWPVCNLYKLIQMRHQSHHSINLKVLDSCQDRSFVEGWRTNTSHLSRKSHRIAYNWWPGCSLYDLILMRHQQSSINKVNSAWQLSGIFVEGWRTHLSREMSPNCLQLKTWLQPVWPHSNRIWSINTQ